MSFRTFCRAEPTFPKSQENWEKEGDLNQDSVKNLKDLELTTKEIDLYFEEHPSRTDGNCFYHSMVDYIEGNDNDSIITIFETREYLQGWETQDSFEEEEMFMMHWLRKLVYQESLKSTTNELNGDAASESTTDFREKLKSGVEQTISDKNEYTDENGNIVQTKSHGHVGIDLWTEDREIDVTARLLGIDICTLQKNGDEDQWVLSFHDPTGVELNGRVCFLKNNGNHFTNLTFKGEAESTAKLLEAARVRRNARKVAKTAENGNRKKDTSKRSRNTENNIGSRKEAWSDFSDDFDDMTQKKLTSWIQKYNSDKHAWQKITNYSSMETKELKDRIRKQIVFDKDETMFDLDRLNAMSRVQLKSWFKHSFYGNKIYGHKDEGFKDISDISEKTNQEIIPIIKGAILREACRNGSVAYVETLVDRKDINVNQADNNGATPLHIASRNGHADVVRLLLTRNNIQINQANDDGETPLLIACKEGNVDIARLLLARNNIQINQAKKGGWTPLSTACYFGHADVVRLLLDNKDIQTNQADEKGTTPLWITCQEGHVDVARLLLARNEIQINKAEEENGMTPLLIACRYGHVGVVRLLLDRKEIQINQAANDGRTPLWAACFYGRVDVVRLLLDKRGIKINQAMGNGTTPLWMACARGHMGVVRLLLAQPGIKINQKDRERHTALEVAIHVGHSQIANLLRQNGGR